MAGLNWKRIGNRDRMRRQGIEDVKGKTPVLEPSEKPRRKVSKVKLREQAAAASLAWRARKAAKGK